MKLQHLIAFAIVLCGCSSDSTSDKADAPKASGASKLAAVVQSDQPSAEGSAAILSFSAQDPLSPDRWQSAIGSAIPVSADAVKIVRDGHALTLATSVKSGRTDFDHAQPIEGDFTLTVEVSVKSSIATRAVSSTIPTGAWFQVHPPDDRNRHAAAPIYLSEKDGTAVIQVLRSGTRVQCISQGKVRGSGSFDGPIQFGLWLNSAGEIDVHQFKLDEVAPQLLAQNSNGNAGGFGVPGENPAAGLPPGFAGGPPGFGPGPAGMQGGFGGLPPGAQGGFGGSPPGAQNGFGNPPETQPDFGGQPAASGFQGTPDDAPPLPNQQAMPTTNALLALAGWHIPRSLPQHQHDAIRNATSISQDAKGLRVRRTEGAPHFPLHYSKLLEGNFIAKLNLVVPAATSKRRAAVRVALRQIDLSDTLLASALPNLASAEEMEHVVTFERYGQEVITLIGDKKVMEQKIDGPIVLQLVLQQELDFWIKSIEVGPFTDADIAKRQKLIGEPLVTQPLPAPVDKVIVGGGGKYLLMHFKGIGKLGLYDVEQAKITKVLSLRGEPFIAAGAKTVVIISETNGVIGRLQLTDFQVEARGKVPPEFNILDIAMGSASAGPVLVASAGEGGRVSAKFLDLQTLKPIEVRADEKFGAGWTRVGDLRASSSGHVFSVSGRQPRLIVASGSDVTEQTHTSLFSLLPGPLGQTVFTDKGRCNSQLRPVASSETISPMIPAATGPFFLSVGVTSASKGSEPTGNLALHVLPSGDKIAEFKDLSVRVSPTNFRSGSLPLDQRIVLEPASGTIVALARTKDKLLIKRFDMKQLLDKTGSDYLLVTSQPPPLVNAGRDYHYQLEVLASSNDVDYELTSGPDGMSVSRSGLLSWQAPSVMAGSTQHVVMSIAAGGKSVFHTFAVRVTDDVKLAANTSKSPTKSNLPTTSKPPAESTASTTKTPPKPMPKPATTEVDPKVPAGYENADVARTPPSKYLPPKTFGFDIPSGPTTLPEKQQVTTTNEYGEGVVAKVYANIGDNRIVMLPNGKLIARSNDEAPLTERPFKPATKKQITDQLAERFPSFTRNATRHFSYVYNTSPNFYTGTSRILETMLPGLKKFAAAHGIKTHNPEVPLVVIMFRTEAQFKLYGAPEGALAYYDSQSNEIVMYEQSPLWRTDPELAFKDTIATIAHEGAHQILANIGVQKRLSMWPMWLSEGLAEYLSPTSFGRDLRWKGAGATHDLRMSSLEFYFKLRGLEDTDESMIKYSVSGYRLSSAGYASAWALTHYLATKHKKEFAAHLREVAQRKPFESPGDLMQSGLIPQNLTLFEKHFGGDLPEMEKQLIEHLKKVPYDPPYADRPHFVGMLEWKVDGKRKRDANVFRIVAQARKWLEDKRKLLSSEGVPRATVSVREYANRQLAERDARQFLGR